MFIMKKGKFVRRTMALAMTSMMTIAMLPISAFAEGNATLEKVDTINSIEKGVNIEMYDYPNAANIGGRWYVSKDGSITQGLVSKTLGEDGFPVTTNTNLSLKEWYSKDGAGVSQSYLNCNNLFSKEQYDKDGTLTYSSFSNYARLMGGDNNVFSVYKNLGTPSNDNKFFYQRGNFFPFNDITDGALSNNTNMYDMDGKALASDNARYNEPLFATQGETDYYFGMYMSTGFNMLKDGQYNGSDMVYEFNGDDDLWIYIDGVLVLDLGGVHDAHSGSINFATGKIVEDTSTQSTPSTNETTLRQRFIDAGGTEDVVKAIFGDKDTFLDNSAHILKMFYMERGAGASNCYVKLNLPTIPEEDVEVDEDTEIVDEDTPDAEEPSDETPVVVDETTSPIETEAPAVVEEEDTTDGTVTVSDEEVANDESPDTGDHNVIWIWVVLAVVSCSGITVYLNKKYQWVKIKRD